MSCSLKSVLCRKLTRLVAQPLTSGIEPSLKPLVGNETRSSLGLTKRLAFPLSDRLELDLAFGDGFVDLAEGGHDLAIRTGELHDAANLVTRRVARQRMIVCAAPSYLDAHGSPATLADLAGHNAVVYRRSGRVRPWLFSREEAPPVEVMPRHRLRLDDLEAIADAAVLGMGLAWLPSWLVRERLTARELVELLPDEGRLPYDVHALWLQTPHLPPKVRVAIDALAAELPGLM